MSCQTPTISAGFLHDPATPAIAIRLDGPAWFAWLEALTTTRFAYPLVDPTRGYIVGIMTARKDPRRRGGHYWSVYRRSGPRLRKIYLGRSSTVTAHRLATIAQALLANARKEEEHIH